MRVPGYQNGRGRDGVVVVLNGYGRRVHAAMFLLQMSIRWVMIGSSLVMMCKRDLFEDAPRTLEFRTGRIRQIIKIDHTILKRGRKADVVIHTVISNTRASRTRGPPLLTSSA